jgi:signal transduction histidine kinase
VHFYKVLELLGDEPDDLTRSDAQVNIARGYLEMKNYPAALKYALLGYQSAAAGEFNSVSRDASEILSEIYAQRGDYRQAYAYVKIYRDLSDSILNAERAEQLAKIRTLYEVNEKEEENIYLRGQVTQSSRKMKTRTLVIIIITILVLVLATLLFLLNKMNNRQLLLNKKLAAQSNELELLNDLKDKFFSFVAHNLKNPFNTIMGFSDLMNRATDMKDLNKAREYSGLIHDLSSQVQKVLANLLDWSRLQRRTFEVKSEIVDITGLIKDVVEMNNKEAARKDISLNINGDGNIFVVADRSMIAAVLQNLVTNAIQFTPASGKISIHCQVKNQYTEVTIADSGIGIPAEKLKTLFNFDFSQVKAVASDPGAAGLGLVLCQEMLHKNGGTIKAESEIGKGSRFIFTLPVAVRHDSLKEKSERHAESTPADVTEELLNSEVNISVALKKELETEIVPEFQEVSRVLSIEDLERFSRKLIATGEKHHHTALAAYGRSLHSLTLGHQVDIILRILPKFGEYLKKVR